MQYNYFILVITARQVQTQMEALNCKMEELQNKLEEKFKSLRTRVSMMAQEENTSRQNSADRPISRSSRRSRIMEAQMFARNQYSTEEDNSWIPKVGKIKSNMHAYKFKHRTSKNIDTLVLCAYMFY